MEFNLAVIILGGSSSIWFYIFPSYQVCQFFSLCDIFFLSIILWSWSYHPNPSFSSQQLGLYSNILPDHLISCHSFTLVPSFIPQHIDFKTLCVITCVKPIFNWLSTSERIYYFFYRKVTCLFTLFTYKANCFTVYWILWFGRNLYL